MWKAIFSTVAMLYGMLALGHSASAALEAAKACHERNNSRGSLDIKVMYGYICCDGNFEERMLSITFKAMHPLEQLVFLGIISKDMSGLVGAASMVKDSCAKADIGE